MTFGEGARENLHFIASAMGQTVSLAGFAPVLCERPAARDEIGVSDTQNVIGLPVGRDATWAREKRVCDPVSREVATGVSGGYTVSTWPRRPES